MSIVKAFNTKLFESLDYLVREFPDLKSIKTTRFQLKTIKSANSKLILNTFWDGLKPYVQQIYSKDEKFFNAMDVSSRGYSLISNRIEHFRGILLDKTDRVSLAHKDHIWNDLQIMCKLAATYHDKDIYDYIIIAEADKVIFRFGTVYRDLTEIIYKISNGKVNCEYECNKNMLKTLLEHYMVTYYPRKRLLGTLAFFEGIDDADAIVITKYRRKIKPETMKTVWALFSNILDCVVQYGSQNRQVEVI